MMKLRPSPIGYDPDKELLRKVAEALGYDLDRVFSEGAEEIEGACPGCQIDGVVDLLKKERVSSYRKGWQRIIDDETPDVQDLIYATDLEAANLYPPQP